MNKKIILFVILTVFFFVLSNLISAEDISEFSVGKRDRPEKLRILVDKVMQPEEGWVTKEWMVKEAANAGFNVFVPRKGYDKLDEVTQVADWCQKYGISYMPWIRGTLEASINEETDGKRYLPANGKEQPIYSPNSDEFWEWLSNYVIAYAKISVRNKNLTGVFLDFENYVIDVSGNAYELSYDDVILYKFAKKKNFKIPVLKFKKRKTWLEKQNLHDDFDNFQVSYWQERCKLLRKEIDKINPLFRFCIYPGPMTSFIRRACYLEWATKRAPIIVADHHTYSKPKEKNQLKALQNNHNKLVEQIEIVTKLGVPFIFIGGIDPNTHPHSDPEFCGKNALMISEASGGYWVFYEGPKYTKDHPEYFKWFAWANKAIMAGQFDLWH